MDDHAPSGAAQPEVPGYDVGRCLGSGGGGSVWLVTEQSTGREYALKCFFAGGPADRGEGEEGIRREVRILSALEHEHLVRAYGVVRLVGPGAGRLGLIMDYAAGASLGQLVSGRGSLEPGETVTVLTPIAQALAYLHGNGFTHGDVAPGNVLFTAHGKPLLADLGVARMVADAAAVPDAGTDGFRDPAPVDAVRAGLQPERDVYSLAALGWYCLTGRAPEPGAQRPPLPLLVPGVPPALAAALESGLQEDRRLRPTAAELASAVHRSAVAAPVDLSVSVHPTVIPQLLTRRTPAGTARGRRVEQLRSLPGRFGRPRKDLLWPATAPAASSVPVSAPAGAGPGAGGVGVRRSARRGTTGRRSLRSGTDRPSAARPARPAHPAHPARPAHPAHPARPARPGRRGIRGVAAVLALVGVLAAAWGLVQVGLPTPFPGFAVNDAGFIADSGPAPAAPGPEPAHAAPWPEPAPSGPGAVPAAPGPGAGAPAAALPPDLQAQLASPDPAEAVRGLARLRSLALSSGDFGLLEQVNVPASAAAVEDGRVSARLKDSGRVLAGFTTLLGSVSPLPAPAGDRGRSVAVVAVTATTPAYEERDATGAVLADAAAAPEQQLRLVLATVEGRWRIQDILPGGGAPAGGDRDAPAAAAPAD